MVGFGIRKYIHSMIHLLNIPKPKITLKDIDPKKLKVWFKTKGNPGYISFKLPAEITDLVYDCFPSFFKNENTGVYLQKITTDFNNYLHKDPRIYALNYILVPGGGNVETCVYDMNDENPISYHIPTEQWHLLKTSYLHCVKNVEQTRYALTISFRFEITDEQLGWLMLKEVL